jgi:hypothetical protein
MVSKRTKVKCLISLSLSHTHTDSIRRNLNPNGEREGCCLKLREVLSFTNCKIIKTLQATVDRETDKASFSFSFCHVKQNLEKATNPLSFL